MKIQEENMEAIVHLLSKEEELLTEWEVEFLQDLKSKLEDDDNPVFSKRQ